MYQFLFIIGLAIWIYSSSCFALSVRFKNSIERDSMVFIVYCSVSNVQGKLSAKNFLNIFKTSVCAMEVINILKKGINFLFFRLAKYKKVTWPQFEKKHMLLLCVVVCCRLLPFVGLCCRLLLFFCYVICLYSFL